jgi:ABC-type glycerol-3-phosphate transport system permease component
MRRAALLGIIGLMIQPAALLLIPVIVIIGHLGLTSTYVGIVLVYAALGAPFGTYMMYTYMQAIPRELFEAARVDGASMLQVLGHVVSPLLTPAIGALIALDFISFWNEFLFALVILQEADRRTLVVGLSTLQGQQVLNVPLVSAGMVISIVPPLLVFILLHRKLFSGLTAGAIK